MLKLLKCLKYASQFKEIQLIQFIKQQKVAKKRLPVEINLFI